MQVTTITVNVQTNVSNDLKKLFHGLTVFNVENPPIKLNGHGVSLGVHDVKNVRAPKGSILSLKLGNEFRGLQTTIPNKKRNNFFMNQLTCILSLGQSNMNVKIFKNSFNITGCKSIEMAEDTIKVLWDRIKLFTEYESHYQFVFEQIMSNYQFSVGYRINLMKLKLLFPIKVIQSKDYRRCDIIPLHNYKRIDDIKYDLVYDSNGITKSYNTNAIVKMKSPLKSPTYTALCYEGEKWSRLDDRLSRCGEWKREEVDDNCRVEKSKKEPYTTFIVYPDTVLMSVRHAQNAQEDYDYFMNIMTEHRGEIQEGNGLDHVSIRNKEKSVDVNITLKF